MIKFKNMVDGLAVASFVGTASAGALGSDELDTAPTCHKKDFLVKSMQEEDNDTPTGLRASNRDWKLEIYADSADGSWTVVGESLKDAGKSGKICRLNANFMGFPNEIHKEKFYQQYFASVPANQAKLNEFIRAAKGGGSK